MRIEQIKVDGEVVGTCTVRELKDLRGRDRNLIEAAAMVQAPIQARVPNLERREDEPEADFVNRLQTTMSKIPLSLADGVNLLEMKDATIVALISDWDLKDEQGNKRPFPTIDTVGDLPADLYTALFEAVGGQEAAQKIATPVDFDPKMDENGKPDTSSPGGESLSSSGSSNGEPTETPVPTPPPSSETLSSEAPSPTSSSSDSGESTASTKPNPVSPTPST